MRYLLAFILFYILSATGVNANAKADFDFQYTKHRESFDEFVLYKKDYLTNPTLDNQQKALLSAKQTTNTRELTRASFAAYLRELILMNQLRGYQMADQLNANLFAAQQFFLSESQKSLSLVTIADLDSFNAAYNLEYPKHERFLKAGIVGHKLTRLKYFALKQDESLQSLKAKIPSNVSVRVFERISGLEADLKTIHTKIDNLSDFLLTEESLDNTQSEVFFSSRIELLAEIRQLQLTWMDKLIDLDLNYAKIWDQQPRGPKTHRRL